MQKSDEWMRNCLPSCDKQQDKINCFLKGETKLEEILKGCGGETENRLAIPARAGLWRRCGIALGSWENAIQKAPLAQDNANETLMF